MLQPNLGVYAQICLHIITVSIQNVFHKVIKRCKMEKNVKEQGGPWKKEESSISKFSATDCLEQKWRVHLSCTRHLRLRALSSVLQFDIILQPPHCTDGNTRQLLLNGKTEMCRSGARSVPVLGDYVL